MSAPKPTAPRDGGAADAAKDTGVPPQDAGQKFQLWFDVPPPTDPEGVSRIDFWTWDVTTQQGYLPCGVESANTMFPLEAIIAGHSYVVAWLPDSGGSVDCNFLSYPVYYSAIGPVNGDIHLTLSLTDLKCTTTTSCFP